jgi:hypothetical protein
MLRTQRNGYSRLDRHWSDLCALGLLVDRQAATAVGFLAL